MTERTDSDLTSKGNKRKSSHAPLATGTAPLSLLLWWNFEARPQAVRRGTAGQPRSGRIGASAASKTRRACRAWHPLQPCTVRPQVGLGLWVVPRLSRNPSTTVCLPARLHQTQFHHPPNLCVALHCRCDRREGIQRKSSNHPVENPVSTFVLVRLTVKPCLAILVNQSLCQPLGYTSALIIVDDTNRMQEKGPSSIRRSAFEEMRPRGGREACLSSRQVRCWASGGGRSKSMRNVDGWSAEWVRVG